MPSSFLTDAALIRHDGREDSQRKHDRRHAIIPLWAAFHEAGAKKRSCIILLCRLRISFFGRFHQHGPQDGWSGIGDWGPGREYQIMDLAWGLGGTRLRHLSQDEARISTPTMMRRLSGPRQDIRDVWTCDNGRLHCYPVDRYNPLINIGTFGMPAQRELSSRQYPSAPVAVLKTSWSSIRKTEHQIVRNPPSTKRRSNITATR